MKIPRLIKVAAVIQLARVGLARRRRFLLRKQWRNRSFGFLALAAGAGAALYAVSRLRETGQAPQWPSKKKLRKEARRAEAARRAAEHASARPPAFHVEKDASPDLKVPLKDLSR